MMTEDQLIEVLQGVKAGRKWGIRYKSSGDLIEQHSQCVDALCRCVPLNDVERIELIPLPEETMFNGVMIPAPLRVAPEIGTVYYVATLETNEYKYKDVWRDDPIDRRRLERGLVHPTAEAAARHGKAMTV
jgi:hypothetical protein